MTCFTFTLLSLKGEEKSQSQSGHEAFFFGPHDGIATSAFPFSELELCTELCALCTQNVEYTFSSMEFVSTFSYLSLGDKLATCSEEI